MGIISVAYRQCPNAMEMVGKNRNSFDYERLLLPRVTKSRTKPLYIAYQAVGGSVLKCYREEVCAAWNEISSVINQLLTLFTIATRISFHSIRATVFGRFQSRVGYAGRNFGSVYSSLSS